MPRGKVIFHGWYMAAVAFIFYGFGMGPAYYTWGFVGPEMIDELQFSATQLGSIFGVFSFIYHMVAPLSGMAIMRWGVRSVVTLGSLTAAAGFFGVARANSVLELYLSFSVLGGLGVGFACILPAQTLMNFWFRRYKARAVAIVFTAGGILAIGINPANSYILQHGGWRAGWEIIGFISLGSAIISFLFIRNTPEDMGLRPDGDSDQSHEVLKEEEDTRPQWTARQAIRTPQFVLITLTQFAYAAPWNAVVVHGRLHLQSMGYSAAFIALLFSIRIGVNCMGRFAGMAGDFVRPTRVLAAALCLEGAGAGLMIFAHNETIAYLSMILLGVGFGAAFISIPVVFADFFGPKAFAVTQGTSRMINSIGGYLVPTLIGLTVDLTGSYSTSLLVVMGLAFMGAIGAFICPPPKPLPAEA